MDKQLLVANPSGKSSRPISFVWAVFTAQDEPWKQKHAQCRHCLDMVIYHRKSEYVLAHLKNCLAFHEDCERTHQTELLKFVITTAKVTNSRRRVARLDAAQPMLAMPLFERAEPYDPGSFIDLNVCDVLGSNIPYDFVRRGINRMLLSVSAEEAARAFDGAHPLGYGDNTDYFTDRLARFLIRYGGRQMVNANCLFPCGGVTDGLNKLITFLNKRSAFRPGPVALVEDTTDPAVVHILQDRGICVQAVATDEDGLVVADLERQLRGLLRPQDGPFAALPWPMLVYLAPTFSIPAGKTMPNMRRLEILQLTAAYNVPVISDESQAFLDFTSELLVLRAQECYQKTGYSVPFKDTSAEPIVAVADMGFRHVFSISSFSHLLAPGLRVGWIETSNEDDRYCLRTNGVESSGGCICYFTATVVAYLMENSEAGIINESKLYTHICNLREAFALRYHTLVKALFKNDRLYFPDDPDGAAGGSGMLLPGYNDEYDENMMGEMIREHAYHDAIRRSLALPQMPSMPLIAGEQPADLRAQAGPAWTHFGPAEQALSYGRHAGQYGMADQQYGMADQQYGMADQQYGMADQQYGMADQQYGMADQQYGMPNQQSGGHLYASHAGASSLEPALPVSAVQPLLYNHVTMGGSPPATRRVGGLFIRVQLPQWLIDMTPSMQAASRSARPGPESGDGRDGPPGKRQRVDGAAKPCSLCWFRDKALRDYQLDFRLDEDHAFSEEHSNFDQSHAWGAGGSSGPGVPPGGGALAARRRYMYLSFSRLPKAALQDAGKRLFSLLSELFHQRLEIHRPSEASGAPSGTPQDAGASGHACSSGGSAVTE